MITMSEIDALRAVVDREREIRRNLLATHHSTADADERIRMAERNVEAAIREWCDQDCVSAEPAPGYWKMNAIAARMDLKAHGRAFEAAMEEHRAALDRINESEAKLREVPCVVPEHLFFDAFPEMIASFVRAVWGEKNLTDRWERTMRVLEEAIEFAQANGVTEALAVLLTRRVYNREAGDPAKEAGDVGITLLAWCYSQGVKLPDLMTKNHDAKLVAKNRDVERLREKQREKAREGFGLPIEGEDFLP